MSTKQVLADIDIALPLYDSRHLVDSCQCDPEGGYGCEVCFTYSTLAAAKREIEQLQRVSDHERYQRIEAAARAVCHYLGDEPDCCPSLSLEARILHLGRVLDSEEP